MKRRSLVALMLMLVLALTVIMVGCNNPIEPPKVDTINVEFNKDAHLKDVPLSLGFTWKNPDESVKFGTHQYDAVYTENGKTADLKISVNMKKSASMLLEDESIAYIEKELKTDAYKKGGAMYENSIYDKYVMILARSYKGIDPVIKSAYMTRVKDLMHTEGYFNPVNNLIAKSVPNDWGGVTTTDFSQNIVMTLIALKENLIVDNIDLAAPFYDKTYVEDATYGAYTYKFRVLKNITIPEKYVTADSKEHSSSATLDSMINFAVGLANPNGGWYMDDYMTGEKVLDVDTTTNAIIALAEFKDKANVKTAIDKAIAAMKTKQLADGGIENFGASNISTTAALISACSAVDVDPATIKHAESGKNLFDYAATQRITEGVANGAYKSDYPDLEGGASTFANNDMFTALVSYNRYLRGEKNFFDIK